MRSCRSEQEVATKAIELAAPSPLAAPRTSATFSSTKAALCWSKRRRCAPGRAVHPPLRPPPALAGLHRRRGSLTGPVTTVLYYGAPRAGLESPDEWRSADFFSARASWRWGSSTLR